MSSAHPLSAILLVALLALTFSPCPLAAFETDMQWGGHFKALGDLQWPESGTILEDISKSPLTTGTLDFRLTNQTRLPWKTEFELHYEAIYRAGDLIRAAREIETESTGSSRTITLLDPDDLDRRRLLDLTATLDEGSSHVFYHRLDRFNLTLLRDWGFLRVGRQAVTWGDGFVFNPMDLFNPFSPTDIERDYKIGDDMAAAQVLFENGADIHGLLVPRRDPDSGDVSSDAASAAAKLHFSSGNLEYDLMAARHYRDLIGGVGTSGYAGGSAWRINATWTALDDHTGGNNDYLSLVANLDYSWNWWQRNFYGFIEYYYNGLGDNDYPAALTDPAVVERIDRGELFVLGKSYLTGQLQAEVHPLFNLYLNVIMNTADSSSITQVWGQWDAAQNLRVVVGGKLATGAGGTEFGGFDLPENGIRVGVTDSLYTRITLFF